jgi:hypothetical protein
MSRTSTFMMTLAILALLAIMFAPTSTVAQASKVINSNTVGPQYITPNILIAVMIGLFLVFILLIGVQCLMGVERPLRMTSTPLQLSKEY